MNTQTTTTTIKKKTNPAKSKAAVKNPKKKLNKQNAAMVRTMLPVSHCGLHFGAVLADPFGAKHGACVPADLFPLPSQKHTVIKKGIFVLGTSGYGYVIMNPPAANDTFAGHVTSATSVGTGSTTLSAYTNTSPIFMDNLPYTTAQISANSIQARVVGCGIRARYSGQLMSRNGTAVIFEEPDHQPLDTRTFDLITGHQQSEEIDVTNWESEYPGDKWMAQVNYSGPTRPQDIEFQAALHPLSMGDTAHSFLGVVVKGVPGDTWTYELIVHLEYIGSIVTERTPSHVDPMVFGKVLEAAKEQTAISPLNPGKSVGFFSRLASGIQENLPMIQEGGRLLKAAVTMDLPSVLQSGARLIANPATRGVLSGQAQRNLLRGSNTHSAAGHFQGSGSSIGNAFSILFGDN